MEVFHGIKTRGHARGLRIAPFLERLLAIADCTVFEHIGLDRNHNTAYEQADRFALPAHCGIADEFATGKAKPCRVAEGKYDTATSQEATEEITAAPRHTGINLRLSEALKARNKEIKDRFKKQGKPSRSLNAHSCACHRQKQWT